MCQSDSHCIIKSFSRYDDKMKSLSREKKQNEVVIITTKQEEKQVMNAWPPMLP